MAFTETRFPPSDDREHPDHVQDVIPSNERSQDPVVTEMTQELTAEGSRPLTDAERKAADREPPAGHTVYAPASERVPVDPVPGHREFVEHPDTHTREREAETERSNETGEPTFARVARPSADPYTPTTSTWNSSNYTDSSSHTSGRWLGMRMGWLTLGLCSGVGVWLWLRWQRERNKPINRLRRQARQAAKEIRERVPTREEAVQPAIGLGTAVLSILLLVWQQTRARSKSTTKAARHATKAAVHDIDWQKRLTKMKDRWSPGRLELEKISISRH